MKRDLEEPRRLPRALSSDDVQGAVRVLQTLQEALQGGRLAPANDVNDDRIVRFAKCLRTLRGERLRLFGGDIFGEPSWDILLNLYIAHREGVRVNVSKACRESGVPETTALRWITRLLELELLRKRPHPTDLRVFFVELTPHSLVRMESLLRAAVEQFQFR